MKIKRKIDGMEYEFELTNRELYDVYFEQQHEFDVLDVKDVFDCMEEDDFQQTYGVTEKEAYKSVEEIASRMRMNIDKYDLCWQDARDDAIFYVLTKLKNAKEDGGEDGGL